MKSKVSSPWPWLLAATALASLGAFGAYFAEIHLKLTDLGHDFQPKSALPRPQMPAAWRGRGRK